MKEPEKVRQPLAAALAKNRNSTFRTRQFAECESMAGLFERDQGMRSTLLVGGVVLDRVDDNHGVQIKEHSRILERGNAPRGVQFPIPLVVFGKARVIFRPQVFRRPPGKAAGTLLGCELPDHIRQAALWPNRWRDSNRDAHGVANGIEGGAFSRSSRSSFFGFLSHAVSIAESSVLAECACLANQDEERRLKGVVDAIRVGEQLAANAQDHRPVPREQRFECRIIPALHKAMDQLALVQTHDRAVAEQSAESVDEFTTRLATCCVSHACLPRSAPRVTDCRDRLDRRPLSTAATAPRGYAIFKAVGLILRPLGTGGEGSRTGNEVQVARDSWESPAPRPRRGVS